MNKDDKVIVRNRDISSVCYNLPELRIRRVFEGYETKELTFDEVEQLSFIPGGLALLRDFLVIETPAARKEILPEAEPEYLYTQKEIKNVMEKGTLDQFLDMLDFAPQGVLDIIKRLAVDLPLNDMAKRDAIFKKTGMNITNAIEVQEARMDEVPERPVPKRRAAVPEAEEKKDEASEAAPAPASASKYRRVSKD